MITLGALAGDRVRHGFFTRDGGVSDGLFRSLNCGFGSGDSAAAVAHNRGLAMARLGLGPDRLTTCRQIHSATVVTVEAPWPREAAPRADAMVTRKPGIALGILSADCAPILFAEPAAGVVGAAHGGWRGALAGVAEATVAAMLALGADPGAIRAAIGPCIGPASYEVGPEFPAPFIAADAASGAFFAAAPRPGHFLFDLPGYLAHRLARAGVMTVEDAGHDTVADEARCFSYRRACLRGETVYGRALAAIALAF